MKILIVLLLCELVACITSKHKYCQVIARQQLYPEVDIVRFCNSYVVTLGNNFCCIKENNRDDVLQHTCFPINQFNSGSENSATLRPQIFRTKPTYPTQAIPTKRLPIDITSTTVPTRLHSMFSTTKNVQQPSSEIVDENRDVDSSSLPYELSDEVLTTMKSDMESIETPSFGQPSYVQTKNNDSYLDENEEEGEALRFTNNWVLRFQRSMQQGSHTIGNEQQDLIVSLFRESVQQFIHEFKEMHQSNSFCPQSNSLTSDSTTFTKTPFDFTFQNIWNAFFYANEWNSKFTFPNFMIDQQSGIAVTILATLIALFCDKQTRDRLASLTDELSQISCLEQFCCPSLFHILKLIFRRAKNPPPRKIIKKKFKHLPKTPMEHISCDQNTENVQKTRNGKPCKKANTKVFFKNSKNPETHIEIEKEHTNHLSVRNNVHKNASFRNKPTIRSSSVNRSKQINQQPDFDRITVVASVHNTSNSNLSFKSAT